MTKLKNMAFAALAAIAISSCDEDTMTVGSSLTNETDKLHLTTAVFDVPSRSVISGPVLAGGSDCYLGRVRDPETGSVVVSEFTTQLHVLEQTVFPTEDNIFQADTNYTKQVSMADSCEIIMILGSSFKKQDELTPMKMRTHELLKPIRENQKFYSDYDPVKLGLLRNGAGSLHEPTNFTYQNLTSNDTMRAKSSYVEHIRVALNRPYTDRHGVTYNNYGSYIIRQYFDHPDYFRNSYSFADSVCPGFFFEMTDGLGFHSKITDLSLCVYYRYNNNDTTKSVYNLFAGTKEVLQTTRITNDTAAIRRLAEDPSEQGHTYLKSPAGLYTELTLPVNNIMGDTIVNGRHEYLHANDSLRAAKVVLYRLNNDTVDYRALSTPSNILLVQKDSLTAFFESNKIPDSKTSYYTTFATKTNSYTFSNISNLITNLWNMKQKGMKAENVDSETWEQRHPNWNKLLWVPVSFITRGRSTSTTITSVENDMSLTSTRLEGGPMTDHPIQVSVVYAK